MERTNPSSTAASPAASSLPDLPEPGELCAIHQPDLFPRLTALAKLFAAECWIVLDDVQFTRRDYQQRARLGDLDEPDRRQWLTLPTHLPQGRQTLIRDALIGDPCLARRKTAGMLRRHYGALAGPRAGPGPSTGCLWQRQDRHRCRNLHPCSAQPARQAGQDPRPQRSALPTGSFPAVHRSLRHHRCPHIRMRSRRHDVPRLGTVRRRGHQHPAVQAADDRYLVVRTESQLAVGVGGPRSARGGRPLRSCVGGELRPITSKAPTASSGGLRRIAR